jgi:hypothetical protein
VFLKAREHPADFRRPAKISCGVVEGMCSARFRPRSFDLFGGCGRWQIIFPRDHLPSGFGFQFQPRFFGDAPPVLAAILFSTMPVAATLSAI